MPFNYVYFPEWDLMSVAEKSFGPSPGSDMIKVKSFEDCKKKSEEYDYVHFLEKWEGSKDYKCFRHYGLNNSIYAVMYDMPGSTYRKFSKYYLDYCVK